MDNNTIGATFETHLKALAPAFPTAYENTNFKPPEGPFQVPTFLFAEPDDIGFKDSPFIQRGIMTVTLAYPTNQGSKQANAKALDIRNHFPRGLSLPLTGGGNVIVDRTPEITGGSIEGDRFIIRVRIRFYAVLEQAA